MLHKGTIDTYFIIIFLFYTCLSIIWQNLSFFFFFTTYSLFVKACGGIFFFLVQAESLWPEFLCLQYLLKAQIISDGVEVVIFLYGV